MAIQISKSRLVPSIDYRYVHINSMRLEMAQENQPLYEFSISIIMYAIIDGKKKFDLQSSKTIHIDDFGNMAREEAAKGNNSLLEALAIFEQLAATYIENTLDVGEVTVI